MIYDFFFLIYDFFFLIFKCVCHFSDKFLNNSSERSRISISERSADSLSSLFLQYSEILIRPFLIDHT